MRQPHHGPLVPGAERRSFLESQPTYWLKRCYQALRRSVDQQLRQYGLTLSQRDVLLALWEDEALDQGALKERLGLEQSSVSRLVDGLVRRDLVTVVPSESDRRVRMAALTPQGRELLRQTPGASELAGQALMAGLSSGEQRELVRLLRHCTANLLEPVTREPE